MAGDLVNIYECEEFILYSTGRDYDFSHCIDNKTGERFKIVMDYDGDEVDVLKDWVGLFAGDRTDFIVEEILKNEYSIEEVEA